MRLPLRPDADHAREPGPRRSPWVRAVVAVLVFAATAAAAQGDADKTFRKWADDSVKVLRESTNADARAKAAEYLGGFEYPSAIEALQAALRDSDSRVRAAAAGALWKTGEPSRPARAALAIALDDPEPAVAIRAAGALESLGTPAAELAPARRRVFEAAAVTPTDRYMAARGLVGFAAPTALLTPIVEFLERASMPRPSSARSIGDRESLESAVRALDRLARTGDRALIPPMQDAARRVRYSQAALLQALALFAPKPDGWTTTLTGFLAAPEATTRRTSLELLGKETREADVLAWAPRAAQLLNDGDELVRSEAVWVLGRAGGLAAAQVDALLPLLRDPDAGMRRRVAEALGEMGDTTQAVTAAAKTRVANAAKPMLASLAQGDADQEVREAARKALARLATTSAVVTEPPPRSTVASRSPGGDSEAKAVALLRERRIAVEPGAYFQALATTDVAVVRAFLDAGMSAATPVAGGGPPLVVALQAGDGCAPNVRPTPDDTRSLVKLLLERGADANRGDANGFTPLMAAAMKGCDRAVMKLLLAAGAKAGATNAAGLAAFDMGVFQGHDGLEELIAAGYRLSPEKASVYEKAFAGKPAVLALVRKAARK